MCGTRVVPVDVSGGGTSRATAPRRAEEVALAQVAEHKQHLFPLLSSWFSLPSLPRRCCYAERRSLGRCLERAETAVSCPGVGCSCRGAAGCICVCWVCLSV